MRRVLSVCTRGIRLDTAILVIIAAAACQQVRAQDQFEIRVEQYEQPVWGGFSLEMHSNYAAVGTRGVLRGMEPSNGQFHLSTEFTTGLTNYASLGVMAMTAIVPRNGLQYAGWKFVPHFYAPSGWHLPLRLGLTEEISFQPAAFAESRGDLELRPVIEKTLGRFQLDLNPAFDRPFGNSTAIKGWGFEPSLRLAYEATPRIKPSFEYYGGVGPFVELPPIREQVHQFYPGVDLRLAPRVLCNLGLGVGLTPAGNRLLFKSRLEFSLERIAE